MPNPIRVLIVDDSVVVRKAVSDALALEKRIEVIGTAANGKIALEKISKLKPEVLILDIEMPVCDGFEVLFSIRKHRIKVRTIMFSTLTERGASQTIKALSLGANDYVPKPTSGSGGYREGLKRVAAELTPKILQFQRTGSLQKNISKVRPISRTPLANGRVRSASKDAAQIVAIGISTGGPEALAKLLPALSASFPVPIVIVQHMPPLFTKLLAERLNANSKIKIVEAQEGMRIEPGVAYIAPGNYHLVLRDRGSKIVLSVNQDPPENSCRPAADVLFRSVAEVFGKCGLGVIMTGMGQDGLKGIRMMRAKEAAILAQDEDSSVVWGMPSYVVHEGLADKTLPLNELAAAITGYVTKKNAVAVHAR